MAWSYFFPQMGEVVLATGIGLALFTLVSSLLGGRQSNELLVRMSERGLYAATFCITACVIILVGSFLSDQFIIRYVYNYSNSSMPWIYKITALWGGQEGSLLFWLWISALFASVAVFRHREKDRDLIPYTISVFAAIQCFFGLLLIFHENPFKLFPTFPADGRGLNPLLQNPSMAIHPPSLYLGYVGMSVPFAFAFSALLSNKLDSRWITTTRRWLLLAWFFLSIGNLLGAQWAYVELGWGGFWGWDPVENAAIMPWFTASAFLHSVMIQERRGMLKFWNMNLIVISFCLTILGTYLTRSGVVQSVHSFARSEIGYYFLGFLILIIVISGILIYLRRRELRSENIFESFLSKESAFVVNNIVLVGTAFIILWCTLFPTASELIIGSRIVVGPPFFNKMLAPFGIALLILTGIGPLIGWKKASPPSLKFHFLWPTLCGLVVMGGVALLQVSHWYVLGTAFGAAFVLTTLVTEFGRGTKARMAHHHESFLIALMRTIFSNNRRYGGYIVHFGIVLIFIGIAGSAYKEVLEYRMKQGDHQVHKEYTIQLMGFKNTQNENQQETYAIIDLYIGANKKATLRPARFFYFQQEQPSTEVDIYSRLKEDVYFTLGQFNPESGEAVIHMTLNPLVSLLWLGGLFLVLGAVISMLPPLRFREAMKS